MALTDLLYGKNYRCPYCNEFYNTKEEADHCIRCGGGLKRCPHCNGTGQIVNWGAPNEKCSHCGGTGQVHY